MSKEQITITVEERAGEGWEYRVSSDAVNTHPRRGSGDTRDLAITAALELVKTTRMQVEPDEEMTTIYWVQNNEEAGEWVLHELKATVYLDGTAQLPDCYFDDGPHKTLSAIDYKIRFVEGEVHLTPEAAWAHAAEYSARKLKEAEDAHAYASDHLDYWVEMSAKLEEG